MLYFYPKDHTSGCTREAQAFQAAKGKFTRLGARIVGVSKDTVKSHEGFAAKHRLTFALVADPEKKIHEKYGVLKEKTVCGRTSVGTERSTFLIDPEGRIRRIWRKVKVAGHVDEVSEALKAARKESKPDLPGRGANAADRRPRRRQGEAGPTAGRRSPRGTIVGKGRPPADAPAGEANRREGEGGAAAPGSRVGLRARVPPRDGDPPGTPRGPAGTGTRER